MCKIFRLIAIFAIVSSTASVEIDHTKFPGVECYRDCNNAVPRVCYFDWHMEHYHAMGPACGSCGRANGNVSDCFKPQCITADGFQRGVMSINRQIPGPAIHVCKDDLIVVDVTNMMGGTAATLHWHGIHQRETPYMDGVPFVTQCPIDYGTTFRYSFKATEAGTNFYHSHTGHHKINGHYGGLIVRRPTHEDPNAGRYDYDLKEHLIVASDWMLEYGEAFMPGLPARPGNLLPTNYLINGRGRIIDTKTCKAKALTPLETFRVRWGGRYRFRFVNGMSIGCPVQLEIQGHKMHIIASDSFDVQPVPVDSLVSTSGERFDFVINANQTGGTYWIRMRALGLCDSLKIEQYAVLSYAPSAVSDQVLAFPTLSLPKWSDTFVRSGVSLNHPNATCEIQSLSKNALCVTDLSSYVNEPSITDVVPDQRFILGFDFYIRPLSEIYAANHYIHFMSLSDGGQAVGGMNNITFTSPPFSLLTQPEEVKESLFCDENNRPPSCDNAGICACPHRIKIALNSIVELVIVDEATAIGQLNHPFHLHGYKLFVTGMGQHPLGIPMTVDLAKQMVRSRKLARAIKPMHPIKDTISVPSRGYTVFRFKADNPGWWLLHCHFEWHANIGMGLVVQVGETNEMVPPPANFPKCNSFQPAVDSSQLK